MEWADTIPRTPAISRAFTCPSTKERNSIHNRVLLIVPFHQHRIKRGDAALPKIGRRAPTSFCDAI